MGMVSSSVKMASTTIRLKNPDKNFARHGKYFQSFSDNCGVLDRIETRLATERACKNDGWDWENIILYFVCSWIFQLYCLNRPQYVCFMMLFFFSLALSSSYEDMSGVAFSWANSEAQLCEPIRKLGSVLEANASSLSSLVSTSIASYEWIHALLSAIYHSTSYLHYL